MAAIDKDDVVKKGVFDNAGESADKNKPKVDSLTESIKKLNQESAKSTKSALKTVNPKDVKSIEELNTLASKANQTARNRLQIDKQLVKEKERLKDFNQRRNKRLREEAILENKQLGTLKRLQVGNRQLVAEREKLNLATKKGQQRLRQINNELDRNNKFIKKNSDKLTQQRIGIGKYSKALNGLRGGLAKLGIAFGVGTIFRNFTKIIGNFQQAQADLASVLGVNVDEMSELTEQAKELGSTTKFTASEVSQLQKEFAKLGFTQKEINAVTEATLQLAAATGTELAEAASVTGGILNAFGLAASDTQQVVDLMAKSFSTSSLDMEKFKVAMATVAPVAKNAGNSIERTTAMLGILTDNNLQASKAGTGLKNIFLELSASGMTYEEAMNQINSATDKNAEAVKLFKKEGATAAVILAEQGVAIEKQTQLLEANTQASLDGESAAADMAETQLKTLKGSIDLLTSAWEGYVLSLDEAGGVGEKLRGLLGFLAKNLNTIISVLGKVVRGFIAFKAAMLSLQLAERTKEFFAHGKAIKKLGEEAPKATSGVKAFGAALKSIGFAVAISFVIEMTQEFIRLTSGMAEATLQAEAFAKATESANKSIEEFNKDNNKIVQDQINDIRELNLSREEEARRINEVTKAAKDRTTARIADLRAQKNEVLALLERAKLEKERLTIAKGSGFFDFSGEDSRNLGKAGLAVQQLNALERNLTTQLIALKDSQEGLNQTVVDGEIELSRMNETTKDQSESTKELTLDVDKLASMVNSLKGSQKDVWEGLSDDSGIKNLDKVIEGLDTLHEADMQRKLDVADIRVLQEEINGDEEALLEARINRINVQLELDKEASESGAERYRLELQSQLDIEALVLESQQRVADEEARILAERAQQQNEYIKSLEQGWVKALDARIALFNDEQKAAEKQADFFKSQSDKGDIEADESITAARERARQAEEEAKKAEKQKQIALMVSAFLQAFNNALGEGKNVGQALGEASVGVAASSALIPSIISAVPTFLEGTENTGSQGQGVDGKGGFHAILHPNEGVATKEVNMKKERAGLTLGSAVDKAIAYDNLVNRDFMSGVTDGNQIAPGWDNHLLVDQMMKVQDEVKNLTQVMEGKSDTSIGEITKHSMAILNRSKQGGRRTTSVFVVKK